MKLTNQERAAVLPLLRHNERHYNTNAICHARNAGPVGTPEHDYALDQAAHCRAVASALRKIIEAVQC